MVLTEEVPDTITSWVASAFAVSPEKGLGVAEAAMVGLTILFVHFFSSGMTLLPSYHFRIEE